jgi:hypothetical protein
MRMLQGSASTNTFSHDWTAPANVATLDIQSFEARIWSIEDRAHLTLARPSRSPRHTQIGQTWARSTMATLGDDLLGTVNKLQDLVFNTIGNDSLDLPQIVCCLPHSANVC